MKPLAIDLYCGLGGWTDGLLANGWRVVGYDIEEHAYGEHQYPAELVLADVRELHGSQFADADLIVASPPCTEYSYMAMPWSRAKQIARALRGEDDFPKGYTGSRTIDELNELFDACFRIQREACEAAGRHIPMVVENVRGAQPWVGRAAWNYGSYYLWGDVPALMPAVPPRSVLEGFKSHGMNWSDPERRGQDFTRIAGQQNEAVKVASEDGGRRTDPGKGARFTSRDCGIEGLKRPGISFSEEGFNVTLARKIASSLKGAKYERTEQDKRQHIGINRKAASALIAKIPFTLSSHIARVYQPAGEAA